MSNKPTIIHQFLTLLEGTWAGEGRRVRRAKATRSVHGSPSGWRNKVGFESTSMNRSRDCVVPPNRGKDFRSLRDFGSLCS